MRPRSASIEKNYPEHDPVASLNESHSQSVLVIENALNQIFDYSEEYRKELVELRNIDLALDSVQDQLPEDDAGQNNLHEILV